MKKEKKTKKEFTLEDDPLGIPALVNSEDPLLSVFPVDSASGKTCVTHKIIENLGIPWVVLFSTDAFYRRLNPEEQQRAHDNNYNFDHPNAFNLKLLIETLSELIKGKKVKIPIYDFTKHRPSEECEYLYGADVIFVEGILALYDQELVNMMDIKLFVDTDDDIRLLRRVERDLRERGRELTGILNQYHRFVKPSFEEFIRPSMKRADVIIPRGVENKAAIDLIVKMVSRKLDASGVMMRYQLVQQISENPNYEPKNLIRLENTQTIRAMCTIVRDRQTNRNEFIFYSNRLTRLIMERCLQELKYVDKTVETSLDGAIYSGKVVLDQVCGVSIIRAGSTMVESLLQIVKDVKLGEILIQTNPDTQEPELHQCRLPTDIADYMVILMDATIATGAAALMAIQVLLEHGVPETRIIFASVIAAMQGVRSISYVHPHVKIVVAQVDSTINEHFHIIPGIGNYADRFFGTD